MIGAEVTINGEKWRVDRKVGYSDQYVYLVHEDGVQSCIRPVAIVQAHLYEGRRDGNA